MINERSKFIVKKNSVFLSLKISYAKANSADPDEMTHNAALLLGLLCLPN